MKKFGVQEKYAMSNQTLRRSAPAMVLTATQNLMRFGASEKDEYSKYASTQSGKFLVMPQPL